MIQPDSRLLPRNVELYPGPSAAFLRLDYSEQIARLPLALPHCYLARACAEMAEAPVTAVKIHRDVPRHACVATPHDLAPGADT